MIDYTSLALSWSYLLPLETQTILSTPVRAWEALKDDIPAASARTKNALRLQPFSILQSRVFYRGASWTHFLTSDPECAISTRFQPVL